jgi:hypothetical protein
VNRDPTPVRWPASALLVIGVIILVLASCAPWAEPGPGAESADLEWEQLEGPTPDGALNYGSSGAFYPQLASYQGRLYATWYESSGGPYQIRVSVFEGGWRFVDGGGPDGLNRDPDQVAIWSRLMVHDGDLYAYWQEGADTDARTIRIARYNGNDAAPSWHYIDGSMEQGLRTSSTATAEYASLASHAGDLYAAWRSAEGGPYRIRVSRLVAAEPSPIWESIDGGTGGINVDSSEDGYYPKLHSHDGELYAAWYERAPAARQLRVARLNDDGAGQVWEQVDGGGPEGLNFSVNNGARGPQLLTHDQELFAVWHEREAPGKRQVRVAAFQKHAGGGVWRFIDGGSASGLNRSVGSDGWWARAASFNDQLYVAWAESEGAGFQIRLSTHHGASDSWSPAEPGNGFNQSEESIAEYPHLISTSDSLYLAWSERNGGAFRVFVMRGAANRREVGVELGIRDFLADPHVDQY